MDLTGRGLPLVSVPAGARALAIGRVAFLLDGADLRYVAIDGVELLRRVGVAVRDTAWDTLVPDDLRVEVRELDDAIAVRAEARHSSAAADVAWTVAVDAAADGELSYAVELAPRAPFAYNRMGICVLHPPQALIGRRYRARTPHDEVEGTFASAIGPQRIAGEQIFPLFPSFSALRVEDADGAATTLRFAGDLFETEDQRNWSDGSFKTYGTPLSRPRPQHAEPGRLISQRVELAPPPAGARRAARSRGGEPVAIDVAAVPAGAVVPGVGLALADSPPSPQSHALLRALGLEHVRVDLRAPAHAAERLTAASATAAAADATLTVALHLRDASELAPLRELLRPYGDAVAWLLAFDDAAEASPGPLVAAARATLGGVLPRARFAGGTDQWFAQLNRMRPDVGAMDGVAWSITPQVHGEDELTIVEALAPQADQVASARAFAPGLDTIVGPVTLRPRYNPAAADARAQALDPPPASIDPRQGSLFAAAWTAASLAQLATAGASAATFYETHGPRGVLTADGTAVLPCWHPLADVGAWAGWAVLPAESAEPLAAQALAVRDPASGTTGLLVANLRGAPTEVRLCGLPAGAALVRTLDARTRAAACADPLAFRTGRSSQADAVDGSLRLALDAHAVATVLVRGPAG
jgi:hypothetical protein